MKKYLKEESGMILMASTMGIFIILSIFAFYLARFSITETRSGTYYVQDIKARNLALSGAEHGMQIFKNTRAINDLTGALNKGSYQVSFDSHNDEANFTLPYEHYILLKSSASIGDVKRNIRYILSSVPEAFCFSFYGNNALNQSFENSIGTISGDMFFNGAIGPESNILNGKTYIGSGSGGILLTSAPDFPQIDSTMYNNLLYEASLASGSYNNSALSFDGEDDYIYIPNSNDINTGNNNHTQKTIEAWFNVYDKSLTSKKQTIYEQGGTTRGLNIYIHSGSLYVGGWNEPNGESDWDPGTFLSTSSIQSNTWHHVALTLSGGNSVSSNAFKGYLDGVEFGSGDGSKLWNHGGDISIARNRDTKFHSGDYSTARYFKGKIDEVRLWNTIRTQQQIYAKKDTILQGNESGLTAYFNFQEDSGDILIDNQNNSNNDGSIKDNPEWSAGPSLSKMGNSSYLNETVNLFSLPDSQLLVNNELLISGSTFNGPGYIVVNGNVTINQGSDIGGNIFIISSGNLTFSGSQAGTNISSPIIIYSKGEALYDNSDIYGLIVSKGSRLEIDNTDLNGAILNYSSTFLLKGDSDINGSVVSRYSVDIQNSMVSITKGNVPEFTGLLTGLDPFIVPGTYLEY